jgi:5S rRNA maturation endonuclease (ribonuclease M5)
MKKKYRSYNQYQLKNLSDTVCDNIENLFLSLGISDYKMMDRMVSMSCPIHGGDNGSAFNLYHQGDSYRGNWKCRTHNCENVFKASVIGFIRGCLSHQRHGWTTDGDETVSFNDAVEYAIELTRHNMLENTISKKALEKNAFVNTIKHIANTDNKQLNLIPRSTIKKSLSIPSQYFIDRGFSKEILNKYDVGDCKIAGKEMYNRAVVPVYNTEMTGMVGCTGRSTYDKCTTCGSHHNGECPEPDDRWLYSKWKHNKNFKTQEYLYNYWYAKEFIEKTKLVVIVESPGNVWRLEESGVHNSVAIFGSSISNKQKILLDSSGAMNIITIMDNDTAGKSAAEQIQEKFGRTYNIKHISIDVSDIAEMAVEEIKIKILPQIKEYETWL